MICFDDIKQGVTNRIIDNSMGKSALSFTGVLMPNFWFIGSLFSLLYQTLDYEKMYAENEKQNIIEIYIKSLSYE